ncbi:EAL domain-containing protein [Uliginosibacterium sp. sgz301328]|uniref:EAL domain-containing response regulator n=1 Tax=Uliginosibacterium sp. sgz301328 TaxID=3243764 RepID=UPI00359EECDF
MAATDDGDELLFLREDGEDVPHARAGGAWRVLIVDDDEDVHATTSLALRSTPVLHRPVEFLHAYSAAQTREILAREADIAVILLDVVMEHDDAGLRLVRQIRDEFGLTDTRIILRTGQPGYAPELEAIRDYDINDYKTKSELTRNKLYTTLTAAIRSYDQIRTINAARRGLTMVVHATGELMALTGMRNFAAGVITQLSALLSVRPEGLICAQDGDGDDSAATPIVIAAAGRYSPLIDQPVSRILDTRIREQINLCLAEERHLFSADGTTLFFSARDHRNMAAWLDTASPVDDATRQLLQVFCANISIGLDNTRLFTSLHERAYFDPLTGLANRVSLVSQLDVRLASPERGEHTLALIDIDQFSDTNDSLGPSFGDALLRAVARRLRGQLPALCEVARIAVDLFGVLGRVEDLMPASLSRLFNEPFQIDGQALRVSATMGIAHLVDVDGDGADAIKYASMAMRRAKVASRGEYAFFTRDMAIEIGERARLLQALRHAVERQRLYAVYQPQIDMRSGRITGVEALLRWRGEDGSLIPPDRFIPLAERSGMIVAIGEWVLRAACRQQAQFARDGLDVGRMAINVSSYQLRHPGFLDMLRSVLDDTAVEPSSIELELTESMAMEEGEHVTLILDAVRAMGVRIAVDDFGTGFSSLSYLQRLHVDRLKIDRGFIRDIAHDERARRIPELVVGLADKLGIETLAEGVETSQQLELLRDMGCREAQGYLFAKPMEAAELQQWLRTRPGGPAPS